MKFSTPISKKKIDGIIGAFFDDICHSKISPAHGERVSLISLGGIVKISTPIRICEKKIDGIIGAFFFRSSRDSEISKKVKCIR